MEVDKELEKIFDDPLLDITDREAELFDIPTDMKKAMEKRQSADYIAQRKRCEDFESYRHRFTQVHKDLRTGKRCLLKLSKTENIEAGNFFIISGQLVLLESMDDAKWTENVRGRNGRTRCIYENGTETGREVVNSSTYNPAPRTAVVGIGSTDPGYVNMMNAAIATGSIDACKATASQIQAQAALAALQGTVPTPPPTTGSIDP